MTTRVLLTGGAGFIGSHLIKHLIDNTNWYIMTLDCLSYASKGWKKLERLNCYHSPRLRCFTWDLNNELTPGMIQELGDINIIIHMAAETHVDNSILEPKKVFLNNVMSTINLLEYARTLKNLQVFQYFSTDEVYGPAAHGTFFKEDDKHNPTNPYSASKSSSENICFAYHNSYGIPIIVTNLMNAYGILQHPEKFIPLVINKILHDETVIIHTEKDKLTPGSRCYVSTGNICKAIFFILQNYTIGERYNITGEAEVSNLELAQKIAAIMDKELKYELVDTHSARPGHDTRYSLDGTKLKNMGFTLTNDFDENLKYVVLWTLENLEWLEF